MSSSSVKGRVVDDGGEVWGRNLPLMRCAGAAELAGLVEEVVGRHVGQAIRVS